MSVAWWALIVASLSFLTSAGMLSWNVYSFCKSGPRVAIKFDTSYCAKRTSGVPLELDEEMLEEWQLVRDSHASDDASFWHQTTTGKVTITNAGRAAVDVTKVELIARNELSNATYGCNLLDGEEGDRPVRLESNSSTVYRFDVAPAGSESNSSGLIFEITAFLGNGKVKRFSSRDNSAFRGQIHMAKTLATPGNALIAAMSGERSQ